MAAGLAPSLLALREFLSGNARSPLYRFPPLRWLLVPWFLVIAAVLTGGACLMMALIFLVDPYDLRPWGVPVRLVDANYPGEVTSRLVRTISGRAQQVVVVGGSPMMAVTPQLLRDAFQVKRAANLSYQVPTWADTAAVLSQVVRIRGLRRIVLEVDHTQSINDFQPYLPAKTVVRFASSNWFDTPDFSIETARAVAANFWTGRFDLPAWRRDHDPILHGPPLDRRPDILRRLEDGRRAVKPDLLDRPTDQPCADNRFIHDALIPAARAAKVAGVQVDVLFAPLPYETYVSLRTDARDWGGFKDGFKAGRIIHFHQCIVSEVGAARLDNVSIHAIDLDGRITCVLANYRDRVHPVRREALQRMLEDAAADRFLLTERSSDRYGKLMADLIHNAMLDQGAEARQAKCLAIAAPADTDLRKQAGAP